jgi:hypothetical protein
MTFAAAMAHSRSHAPKNAVELCRRLHQLFPAFGESLATAYFMMESEFTPHAVCSQFSTFYRNRVTDFAAPEAVALFDMIEVIAAADPDDTDPVANALLTCFLENISATPAGEASIPLMGPRSRRFFLGWHLPAQKSPP